MRLVCRYLFLSGVGLLHPDRGVITFRGLDLNGPVQFFEAVQNLFLEAALQLLGRQIAIGHEHRIGWMIVSIVKRFEFCVAQVRYMFRITAAVKVIGTVGKQVLAQCLPQHAGRCAHRPFHFVEYNTLEYQVSVWIFSRFELHPMPFLSEIEFMQS